MPGERYAARLPGAYARTGNSVNARVLGIAEAALDAARDDLAGVDASAALEGADGATLDLFGGMLGQARGQLADEQYRSVLRSRLARMFVAGDHGSIMRAIESIFAAGPQDIILREAGEPATVVALRLAPSALARAGLTSGQAMEVIARLLPAGVALRGGMVEGTLAFAAQEGEYEPQAGLADDAGEVGGTLGLLVGDEPGGELPL